MGLTVLTQGAAYPSRHILESAMARFPSDGILVGQIPPKGHLPGGSELTTFFPSGPLGLSSAMTSRGATYWRASLNQVARSFQNHEIEPELAIVKVTDARHGFYSLAYHSDYALPLAEASSRLFLETCPHAPWLGRHIARDDPRVVGVLQGCRDGHPRPALRTTRDPARVAIASQTASVVPTNAKVQLGMGAWTTAVAVQLARRGIRSFHTGLTSRWLVNITDAISDWDGLSVITSALEDDEQLESVVCALYSRGRLRLEPATYVHDPQVLASLGVFVAINTAWEVDLSAQANCEYLSLNGDARRSGIGGLPDFATAAASNPDGLSIIALPSMAHGRSRIVPRLAPDRISVRADCVDMIITEYGMADLRGVDSATRSERILRVAHPSARTSLLRELA